jgi:hypothetical protein
MAGYAVSNAIPDTSAVGRYRRNVTAANVSAKFRTIQRRCALVSPERMARYARPPV